MSEEQPWRRPRRGPTPIAASLDRVAARFGMRNASALGVLAETWPDVVGVAIADHVVPVRFSEGVLYLDADDPGWVTQMAFLQADVLAKLRESMGDQAPEKLEVRPRRSPRAPRNP